MTARGAPESVCALVGFMEAQSDSRRCRCMELLVQVVDAQIKMKTEEVGRKEQISRR